MDIGVAYLDEARRALRGHKRLAEGALAQLSDQEMLHAPDPESLSVALLIKHIAGNARSRFTDFLTSDGEKPWRHRDREFEMAPGTTRAELMRWWEEGWNLVFSAVDSLKPADLARTVTIRGQEHTVLQALHRATAHYAYHVGQIVYVAKHIRGPAWKSLSIPKGQSEDRQATQEAERQRP